MYHVNPACRVIADRGMLGGKVGAEKSGGICAHVCPVDNIEIIDDKPVGLHHCESCLACFAWCPHQAIYGGILSAKAERYHHPDVKLRDMIN